MKQVTKAQFDYYCQRIRYWLKKFGTTDWTVYFGQEEMECAGRLRYDYDARGATFLLPFTVEDNSRDSLDETALHEVIHLVLAPLEAMGERRFVSEGEMQGAYEGVTCEITAAFRTFLK